MGIPCLIRGVLNSPASTIFAVGSALRIPLLKTLRRPTYCLAFGFRYQKLGELTSFQSCQSTIGSFGVVGCSDQNVPLAPYRAAAAWTKARKSFMWALEGG